MCGCGGREKACCHLRWGKPFRRHNLYGYRRGVREKVCYHLRWGKIFRKLGLYAYPAGVGLQSPDGGEGLIKDYDLYGYRRGGTFDSPKVPKSDLG